MAERRLGEAKGVESRWGVQIKGDLSTSNLLFADRRTSVPCKERFRFQGYGAFTSKLV